MNRAIIFRAFAPLILRSATSLRRMFVSADMDDVTLSIEEGKVFGQLLVRQFGIEFAHLGGVLGFGLLPRHLAHITEQHVVIYQNQDRRQ